MHFNSNVENEFYGSLFQRETQRILLEENQWLEKQSNIFSQGRTLLILDSYNFDLNKIFFLIKKFKRTLINIRKSDQLYLLNKLKENEFRVNKEFSLLEGNAKSIIDHSKKKISTNTFPSDWFLEKITSTSSFKDIRKIQYLHLTSGLTPLPGNFIRGSYTQSSTLILRNQFNEIVGCATIQNLSSKNDQKRSAMVLGLCLRKDVRGRGLSPLLNFSILNFGISYYNVNILYEIIENNNILSLKMNRKCSLIPSENEGYLFVTTEK